MDTREQGVTVGALSPITAWVKAEFVFTDGGQAERIVTRGGARPGRRAKPYRGRYRPLLDLLAATQADQLVLTFPEIEAMIGMPLAPSARRSASVWTKVDRGYVRHWHAMGWSAHPDMRAGRVEWRRAAIGETST